MVNIKEISPKPFDNARTIEVSINTPTGIFILNTLLPEFWQIFQKSKTRLHTDPERKRIVVPEQFFTSQGNLFSLLHEIGHAYLDEDKSEEEIEEELYLRYKFSHLGKESLTENEKKLFKQIIFTGEKKAWDFATCAYNELKKRGVDLEPTTSDKFLQKHIKERLESYRV